MKKSVTLTPECIEKIAQLLKSEMDNKKNHLVAATLSENKKFNDMALDCAKDIKYLQELFGKFNGASLSLNGESGFKKQDVEFYSYHN